MMKTFMLTLAAFGLATSCAKHDASADAPRAVAIQVVPVARVSRTDLSSSSIMTAEFEPFQEVEVMAKVSGYVKNINVDIGDRVSAGQVLAVLEIPEMQDDLTRATAAIQQTDAEISAARDELTRAESAYNIAHVSFTRLQEVSKREKGLVPLQETDEMQSRELIAQAQVAAAKSKLRVAEEHAQVAKADAGRVRTMGKYVTIAAPFAGMVTKRYANIGALVQAGTASQSQAMPVVRLSQTGLLRLSLPVPESMVPTVRVGRPVEVRVASLGRTFEGRVARYSGKIDVATRTMITEVDVPNPSGVILPGMYAEVTLGLDEHKGVLAAPLEAIERSNAGTRAFIVSPSGQVKAVTVKLGIEDSTRAEVVSGLAEGDQVIVGQRAGLKEGETVRAKVTEPAISRN